MIKEEVLHTSTSSQSGSKLYCEQHSSVAEETFPLDEKAVRRNQHGTKTHLTYYEALDSVAVTEQSMLDVVSSLKLELLLGKRIALSVNQAFDSQVIQGCLDDPAFRHLLMHGDIIVVTWPDAPSVASALQRALTTPGFHFSSQPRLNEDSDLRQDTIEALNDGDPQRAKDLAQYVENILMIDSLLALAPRCHVDPMYKQRDSFPKLVARLAEKQPEGVRALLKAEHHSRSDIYDALDKWRGNTQVPEDEYK